MRILITGGHSGMGLVLSRRLLEEGHEIVLIVRSDARKEETLKRFPDHSNMNVLVADLSKRDEIAMVVQEIQSMWDYLDGIFNNAGVLLDKLYYSDYGNELQLEINAISPYLLTKALLPFLRLSENPFVVSTATAALEKRRSLDIAAFKKPKKFTKLMGSYMDSKITMVALMNHLAGQYEKVRFVHVNPGAIKTKMTSGSGMPWLLKPIRNLFFKSPEYGAANIYQAAFGDIFQGSGIYVSDHKLKPIPAEITASQVEELMRHN